MNGFTQEAEGLYRLCVPFENIWTAVFLFLTEKGPVLYDCATTDSDVENVLLPALQQLGIPPKQLHALVISHAHGDHSGGLTAVLQHAPQLRVIACSPQKYACDVHTPEDGEELFHGISAVHLPGHTSDCLGLYDQRTDTLLSADALQLRGIARFGCSVACPDCYQQTVEKIRRLAPHTILASHAYAPYGDRAQGKEETARYLDGCLEVLSEIKTFAEGHSHLDEDAVAQAFRTQHPHWPPIAKATVKNLLQKQP